MGTILEHKVSQILKLSKKIQIIFDFEMRFRLFLTTRLKVSEQIFEQKSSPM
jgi:hypothetical protein